MKLTASSVPKTAKAAALPVYRWDDETGKTIDTYGYGTTGNAGNFAQVLRGGNDVRIARTCYHDIVDCIQRVS